MKKLSFSQLESVNGGLCVSPPNGQSGICLPCPAFVVIFEGNMGGFGGAPICIA